MELIQGFTFPQVPVRVDLLRSARESASAAAEKRAKTDLVAALNAFPDLEARLRSTLSKFARAFKTVGLLVRASLATDVAHGAPSSPSSSSSSSSSSSGRDALQAMLTLDEDTIQQITSRDGGVKEGEATRVGSTIEAATDNETVGDDARVLMPSSRIDTDGETEEEKREEEEEEEEGRKGTGGGHAVMTQSGGAGEVEWEEETEGEDDDKAEDDARANARADLDDSAIDDLLWPADVAGSRANAEQEYEGEAGVAVAGDDGGVDGDADTLSSSSSTSSSSSSSSSSSIPSASLSTSSSLPHVTLSIRQLPNVATMPVFALPSARPWLEEVASLAREAKTVHVPSLEGIIARAEAVQLPRPAEDDTATSTTEGTETATSTSTASSSRRVQRWLEQTRRKTLLLDKARAWVALLHDVVIDRCALLGITHVDAKEAGAAGADGADGAVGENNTLSALKKSQQPQGTPSSFTAPRGIPLQPMSLSMLASTAPQDHPSQQNIAVDNVNAGLVARSRSAESTGVQVLGEHHSPQLQSWPSRSSVHISRDLLLNDASHTL